MGRKFFKLEGFCKMHISAVKLLNEFNKNFHSAGKKNYILQDLRVKEKGRNLSDLAMNLPV